MDRRTFLGQLAAAAAVSAFPETNLRAQQVPNSVGIARPRMAVPGELLILRVYHQTRRPIVR